MRERESIPADQKMREGEFVVDVEKFINMTRGRLDFTDDAVKVMLSKCHDEGRDSLWKVNNQDFRIPLASINEFFKRWKKPEQPMAPEVEVLLLRKKIEEYEKELGAKEEKPEFPISEPEFEDPALKAIEEDETIPEEVKRKLAVTPKKAPPKKKGAKRKPPSRTTPIKAAPQKKEGDFDIEELSKELSKEMEGKSPDITHRVDVGR